MTRKTNSKSKVDNVVSKEDLVREKEDIEGLRTHLEGEYRKANISEKNYNELKEKYDRRLSEIASAISNEPSTDNSETDKSENSGTPETSETTEEIETPEPRLEVATGPTKEKPNQKPRDLQQSGEVQRAVGQIEDNKVGSNLPFLENIKEVISSMLGGLGKLLKRGGDSQQSQPQAGGGLLGQSNLQPENASVGGGNSEDADLIEQAALAVGSTMEGAADMIEGAEEKMAALKETGGPQFVEESSQQAGGPQPQSPQSAQSTPHPAVPGAAASTSGVQMFAMAPPASNVEIEKLKVMIDSMRDSKKSSDERVQSLAESIGEVRSMSFQTDGSVRQLEAKMDKMEDEFSEVKPKEIDKRFREIDTAMERRQLALETLTRKTEDLSTKVNKVHDIMKGAGNIENLINVNNSIQKKITDIKDIIKYIERIAFKSEKVYIDLNKKMEDFTLYKTKQEDMEESIRELVKGVDKFNLELENYMKKSEAEDLKELMIGLQKEMAELNKTVPVLKAKLPAPITDLLSQKEDVVLFLDTIKDNLDAKAISKEEYESVKKKNMEKLDEINKELKNEWDKLEEYSKRSSVVEPVPKAETEQRPTPPSAPKIETPKESKSKPVISPKPKPTLSPKTKESEIESEEGSNPDEESKVEEPPVEQPSIEAPDVKEVQVEEKGLDKTESETKSETKPETKTKKKSKETPLSKQEKLYEKPTIIKPEQKIETKKDENKEKTEELKKGVSEIEEEVEPLDDDYAEEDIDGLAELSSSRSPKKRGRKKNSEKTPEDIENKKEEVKSKSFFSRMRRKSTKD